MWFEADTDVTIPFDYLVEGEFVVPDTATYVVRYHDGTTLGTGSLPATSTSETVSVSAANNAITADWENRYVKVTFTKDGWTYHRTVSYKLSAFIPMTVGAEDVRALIGLSPQELPDRDIDLNAAYFSLVETYGASMTEALTQTGARNAAINESIAVQAALNTMASLPLRALLTVRSEDSSAARSKYVDFDEIHKKLTARLATLIDVARATTAVTPVIFDFSSPDDAITG